MSMVPVDGVVMECAKRCCGPAFAPSLTKYGEEFEVTHLRRTVMAIALLTIARSSGIHSTMDIGCRRPPK